MNGVNRLWISYVQYYKYGFTIGEIDMDRSMNMYWYVK